MKKMEKYYFLIAIVVALFAVGILVNAYLDAADCPKCLIGSNSGSGF